MQLVLLSGNRVGNIKRKLLMLSLPLTLIHGEKCFCVYCLHLNSKIYVENLIKAHSLIMHHASLLTFVSSVDFYNTGNGKRSLTLISEPIFKIYMLHLSTGKVMECCLRSNILQRKKKKTVSQWLVESTQTSVCLCAFSSRRAETHSLLSGLHFSYWALSRLVTKQLICEW